MWPNPAAATSAKDNSPAPRDLNQSFQLMATRRQHFLGPNPVAKIYSIPWQGALHPKQSNQATVHRLEADQFDEIDDADRCHG
jgi:hypothetical protein